MVMAMAAAFPDRAAVTMNQKAPMPTPNIRAELTMWSRRIMSRLNPLLQSSGSVDGCPFCAHRVLTVAEGIPAGLPRATEYGVARERAPTRWRRRWMR